MAVRKLTILECDRCTHKEEGDGDQPPPGWRDDRLKIPMLLCPTCDESLVYWMDNPDAQPEAITPVGALTGEERYLLLFRGLSEIGVRHPHYLALEMAKEGYMRVHEALPHWSAERLSMIRFIGEDSLKSLEQYRFNLNGKAAML